jgi:3-hydroxybutyrate dehydrogenase
MRVALVTGGTAGIGAAVAEALQAAGYRVAANYGSNEAVAQAFSGRTGIPAFGWNVADPAACRQGVARVLAELGPVEVLVNNAGITRDAMLHKMSFEQWREVLDVNLGGCFNMCRAVIEGMRERRFGRIVNVGSIHSLVASPYKSAYVAAKHGLVGFSKAIALETANVDITINTICPSYVRTPLVDQQIAAQARTRGIPESEVIDRIMLEPMPKHVFIGLDEIAGIIAFLISPSARNITGQMIVVDGGWTVR